MMLQTDKANELRTNLQGVDERLPLTKPFHQFWRNGAMGK